MELCVLSASMKNIIHKRAIWASMIALKMTATTRQRGDKDDNEVDAKISKGKAVSSIQL